MNSKLQSRLEGLEGAAVAAGPKALYEWSLLNQGAADDETSFASVKDFETRLRNMPRINRLDETLPAAKRRLVLPDAPEQPDSELLQLEKEASQACGMWVGRDETKPRR